MQVGLHPTPPRIAFAIVLLANMAVDAAGRSAGSLLRTGGGFDHVLEHALDARLEGAVVEGTVQLGTYALQMVDVAGFDGLEARVVGGPFFFAWLA